MAGIKKTTIILGLGVVLLPLTALSTEQLNDNQASQKTKIAKDEWLAQVKKIVPEPICKGFIEDPQIKDRFEKVNMTYEGCLKEIPALTQTCINQFQNQIPNEINRQTAAKWGHQIGQCIGNNFANKYLTLDDAEQPGNQKKNETNQQIKDDKQAVDQKNNTKSE